MNNPESESNDITKKQVGGDHYVKMGALQPWKVLPAWLSHDELRGYAKGEAIAYLAREREKGGIEDIRKAHHVLGLYLNAYDAAQNDKNILEPCHRKRFYNEIMTDRILPRKLEDWKGNDD